MRIIVIATCFAVVGYIAYEVRKDMNAKADAAQADAKVNAARSRAILERCKREVANSTISDRKKRSCEILISLE